MGPEHPQGAEGGARVGPQMLWPGGDRPSGTAPLPTQAGAAQKEARPISSHLLPLLPLALGVLQRCLQLHNVPPEKFSRHHSSQPPPSGQGGHNHQRQDKRQRERKRGQGGAQPTPYVTSRTRIARRGENNAVLGLNSSLATKSPANDCERSRFAHPCPNVIGF